jgi:hypothetical protein
MDNFQSNAEGPEDNKMWQFKNVALWAGRLAMRGPVLAGTTTLLAALAFVPTAGAQIVIDVGVNPPPVCSYGYHNYAPYGCAPSGFYGPGYFYNGVFLGVGPWANWGYGHGWGEHRFSGGRGGRYVGVRASGGGRAYASNRGSGPSVARASNGGAHAAAVRGGVSHGTAHAGAAHSSVSHGGGEHH